ncbi:MAG: C10 family peptidase [Desulfococcaceae bacterium]
MKKALIFVSFLLLLPGIAFPAPVSLDTLKRVAVNWMAEKSTGYLDFPSIVEDGEKSISGGKSFYVFNFSPEGWVIISADDVAFPVIGYSLTGTWAADHQSPNLTEWMEKVDRAIITAGRERNTIPAYIKEAWVRLNSSPEEFSGSSVPQSRSLPLTPSDPQVGPLLGTITWNQDYYYNESCPADSRGPGGHTYAGCVAAAMSQIMKYHAHPDQGIGSNSYTDPLNYDKFNNIITGSDYGEQTADFGSTTYNWANMPDSISSSNPDIAQLLYHCGVSVNMNFGPEGSSGSTKSAMYALMNYFKYKESAYFVEKTSYVNSDWENLLKAEISAGRPILYSGSGSSGHAFVCDGFDNSDPILFHFNWGWGGNHDGYYLLSGLTPDDRNYSEGQDAVLGIEPSVDPTLVYPYSEGFENGLPDEWLISGNFASLSSLEAHAGSISLLLGDPNVHTTGVNTAVLKINVPSDGAALSFWVKRGYDSGASEWNSHYVLIKPQFGTEILSTIFDGNYNDVEWVQKVVDLSPWQNQVITLIFGQKNNSTSWNEWMYIDDIKITELPFVDFTVERTEWFANRPLQFTNLSANADTYSWTFTGASTATSPLVHPEIIYPSPGTYSVSLTGQNTSGSDTVTRNSYITILPEPVLPYTNNFNTDDGGFSAYVITGYGGQWEWGSCNSPSFNGSLATIEGQAGWATVLNDYHGYNTTYALETPPFSLSDPAGNYMLEFKFRAACGTDAGMNVEYSTDGGDTWFVLGEVNDPSGTNWYDYSTVPGLNNNPGWMNQPILSQVIQPSYDISFLANEADVRFRFVFGSLTWASDGIQIDEFKITYESDSLMPEIDLRGNNISIATADASPSLADGTDFGEVETLVGNKEQTFVIYNTGSDDLMISNPLISGPPEKDFKVISWPSLLIPPDGQTSFEISFFPQIDGLRSATVTLENSDPDENPYTFSIQGNGTTSAAPEIEVQGNSILITDGDSTPSSADNTDFGVISIFDETVSHSFVVYNLGTGTLDLTYPEITGQSEADFSITQPPATSISPGGQTTFTVTFNPSVEGDRTAIIEIGNNDSDENPYNFNIQGTGKPFGDVEGDSDVDLGDVIITLKVLTGITAPSVNLNADVDGDQKTGLQEAVYILRKVAELQ